MLMSAAEEAQRKYTPVTAFDEQPTATVLKKGEGEESQKTPGVFLEQVHKQRIQTHKSRIMSLKI